MHNSRCDNVQTLLGTTMWRRTLPIPLNLVLYFLTVPLAAQCANGVSYLFLKAGSPVPWMWLQTHLLMRGFLVGVFAGLLPAKAMRSIFGWFRPVEMPLLQDLDIDKLRRWTWLIFAPLLLFDVEQWRREQSLYSSVFAAGSPYTVSSFLNYFLTTTDCSHVLSWSSAAEFDCMERPVIRWLLATSIGFSLAPSIRKWGQIVFHSEYQQPDESVLADEGNESTISQKIDTK
jgi:hypothetical protein